MSRSRKLFPLLFPSKEGEQREHFCAGRSREQSGTDRNSGTVDEEGHR